jgi:hypothetical protein
MAIGLCNHTPHPFVSSSPFYSMQFMVMYVFLGIIIIIILRFLIFLDDCGSLDLWTLTLKNMKRKINK